MYYEVCARIGVVSYDQSGGGRSRFDAWHAQDEYINAVIRTFYGFYVHYYPHVPRHVDTLVYF